MRNADAAHTDATKLHVWVIVNRAMKSNPLTSIRPPNGRQGTGCRLAWLPRLVVVAVKINPDRLFLPRRHLNVSNADCARTSQKIVGIQLIRFRLNCLCYV